jgi:hypothetical protein
MSANSVEGMPLFSLPEMTPMQKPPGPPPVNYATHPKRLARSGTNSAPSYPADQSTVYDGTTASPTPLKASADRTFLAEILANNPPLDAAAIDPLLGNTRSHTSSITSPQATSSPNRVNADSAALSDGLADSFHHLSIAGSSQNVRPPPFAPPTFAETYHYAPPKKYYSVTVGRRTGVLFPWYVLSFIFLLFR